MALRMDQVYALGKSGSRGGRRCGFHALSDGPGPGPELDPTPAKNRLELESILLISIYTLGLYRMYLVLNQRQGLVSIHTQLVNVHCKVPVAPGSQADGLFSI